MRRLRQRVAQAIWSVASWIYPYVDGEYDAEHSRSWEAHVIWASTEKDANVLFEQLTELACQDPDHHPMAPCAFQVASFGPLEDEE